MAFFGRSAPPSRLEELRKLIAQEPGSRQFLALAEELRKEGEFAEAIRTLQLGLRYHPIYVAAHVALGRICRESGRTDDALRAFRNALKVDRDNLVAIKQIGSLCLERGDKLEAVKKFKLYRGLNPGDKDLAELIDRLDGELGTTTRVRPTMAAPPRSRPTSLPIPSRALPPEPVRPSSVPPASPPDLQGKAAVADVSVPEEEMAGPSLSALIAARFATRPVEPDDERAVGLAGRVEPPSPTASRPPVPPAPAVLREDSPPEPRAFLEMTYDTPAVSREGSKLVLPPEPPPPEEVFQFDFDLSAMDGATTPPPLPSASVAEVAEVAEVADVAKAEVAVVAEAETVTLPWASVPSPPAQQEAFSVPFDAFGAFDANATVAVRRPPAAREEIVTETLAELYVAQGLGPEARDAYFALARAEADPSRAARLLEKAERMASPALLPPPPLPPLLPPASPVVPAQDSRAVRLREWAARVERKEPDGDLKGIVAGLVASESGIDFAIVTETDGVPLVTSGPFGAVEESLSAELAAFWKNLQREREDVGAGDAKLVSLSARNGGFVIAPVGPEYALIVRSSASAPPGLVRWEAARAASRLRPLLA